MDNASDFESEDCEFESRRGRIFFLNLKTNNLNMSFFFDIYKQYYWSKNNFPDGESNPGRRGESAES